MAVPKDTIMRVSGIKWKRGRSSHAFQDPGFIFSMN